MSDDSLTADQVEDLVSSFRSARSTYEAFAENVSTLLVSLLRAEGIEHLSIEKRTKTVESFRGKLIRPEKEDKYLELSDMTDLAGVRIVAYYEKDVESICRTIRSNFLVDEANSTDKTSTIDPDRFGYLSKHFVVLHGSHRRNLPENIQFADLKVEIQVRTVVQHAWAVIDRRLRYNNEADIPRELRRKLFRTSALLELADKEFSEIDTAVTRLRSEYEEGVRSGDLQIEINRDSVEAFLKGSPTVERLRSVARNAGTRVTTSDAGLTGLVQTISESGLTSIEQLDKILDPKEGLDGRLVSFLKVRSGLGMTSAALVRMCVILGLPKEKAIEVFKKNPFSNPRTALAFKKILDF